MYQEGDIFTVECPESWYFSDVYTEGQVGEEIASCTSPSGTKVSYFNPNLEHSIVCNGEYVQIAENIRRYKFEEDVWQVFTYSKYSTDGSTSNLAQGHITGVWSWGISNTNTNDLVSADRIVSKNLGDIL
ncbi:hypothetical protein KC717_00230 [Candidatus Dojkabacteria bacterium]|uniref:Uncharacterized protein n=1 Tax=Candidatus Dojkabacteria bacterium TaxID=2099670 RepID=A0A955L747_9BACT|nr:hypothetical protein [Candidatus Dojkabacteria bacterium]